MWSENSSQWTTLEPLCYAMLVKAILVHGVIGYKFCWLLPSEDHNQGTLAGHVSNGTTVRDHWEDMNQLRHQLGTNHHAISKINQKVFFFSKFSSTYIRVSYKTCVQLSQVILLVQRNRILGW